MVLTVENYLKSAKHELQYWRNEKYILNYDNSISKSCYNALINHKIKVFSDVIDYLKSLPSNTVLTTGTGRTNEGSIYFDIVNK